MANRDRRDFLKTSAAALTAGSMPYWFTGESAQASNFKSANERPVLGCIGTGSRWGGVGPGAMNFSDCAAVCDADANHAGRGRDRVKKKQPGAGKNRAIAVYEDYRKILDRSDIEVVTIVTPDHWHAKIAIEALQAGKDVYCEKPLTLTIQEGKQIIEVLDKTKRVFQVGTQQRTEMGRNFLRAIAMIRDGRIGKVKRAICDIGGAPQSGPIAKADVPKGLNWELWQGQTPLTDYRHVGKGRGKTRCHYEFRWWYEYSGGKMTDWGAHHVDIAQWALGQNGANQGVLSLDPLTAEHPVTLKDGMPVEDDRYNTSNRFHVKCLFPQDVELHIVSKSKDGNGILFEGTEGRFHVGRRRLKGGAFEDLKSKPLPEGAIAAVYGGKEPTSHMENFFNCIKSKELPISDVYSHHRALTTCHLANIAIRLGRKLNWNPKTQEIVGDKVANSFQAREQRKGFEIKV